MLQFYTQRHQSIAKPHSIHTTHHPSSTTFNHQNRRESFDSEINRPLYHDKERELYEQHVDFERELENERFVGSQFYILDNNLSKAIFSSIV